MKIAFIDDDETVRTALAIYLKLHGFTVLEAGSLTELASLLDQADHSPDIVVSDYRLGPGEFGSEAIAIARKKFGETFPAIILTADVSLTAENLGGSKYTRLLPKPLALDSLVSTVRELVGARLAM